VLRFSYGFFYENAWIECYDGARQLSSHLFQISFLVEFAKLREASIGFVMSVRLSLHMFARAEQRGSHSTDFLYIVCLRIFSEICQENSSSINI